jgi:hypothetical protein
VKLGKSATETFEILREAFGEHSLNRTAVFEWRSCFKAVRVSAEDDEHSRLPSTTRTIENVEKIRELTNKDCRRTMHELADTVVISYGVCQILRENMNMRRIASNFVPRLSTNDQKQRCVNVCLELREKANEDPTFISKIVTGDDSWIYGYDSETKQQSS